jgi:hypothetical protein
MKAATKTAAIVLLCGACGVGGISLAQEGDRAAAEVEASPPATDDTIVVQGQSLGLLRSEILRAEELVFARFNDINSDDEFDIDCRMEVPTGSRVPRRVCRANFWREVEIDIAEEAIFWMQGSAYSGPGQSNRGLQPYKSELLREEIRRLATEDEQFRAELTNLATAHQALAETRGSPEPTADSASRQVPADEDGLPYGAASVVEVRVGRKPWTYALTRRTFTLAHLYGEIRSIEVECEARNARLQHEVGVEWTIPDAWRSCTLVIDAARDTTFALYEFE